MVYHNAKVETRSRKSETQDKIIPLEAIALKNFFDVVFRTEALSKIIC